MLSSYDKLQKIIENMKKNGFKMAALITALMITMTAYAKSQDVGGRVIDENGQPLPYVNVVLLSLPDSSFVQGP